MSIFDKSRQNILPGAFHLAARTASLICTAALVLSADTLVLRNGATVQGTYLGGDARQVRIDQNGTVRNYDIGAGAVGNFLGQSAISRPPPAYPALLFD